MSREFRPLPETATLLVPLLWKEIALVLFVSRGLKQLSGKFNSDRTQK
tara:strand:+ start:119 stop:262 length:144 start_codon:yes stop_codon:yes gene_type:complete